MKKQNNLLYCLLLCLSMLACTDERYAAPIGEEMEHGDRSASLTLAMRWPEVGIDTRGVSDVPSDPSGWSDWERAVDGRYLYHVTLFLIDKNGTLVAYRDIHPGSVDLCSDPNTYGRNGFYKGGVFSTGHETGDSLVVTFRYDHPWHGQTERLSRGTYTLMAVANYTAHTADDYGTPMAYEGLGGGDFRNTVSDILDAFSAESGLVGFTADNYADFFNARLDAGADCVASRVPQALTLVQDIELHPGDNYLGVQLVRTYARIRIELENNSGTHDLNVNGLTFSSNFAGRYANLFGTDYTLSKGAPDASSTDAITPFTSSVIPMLGGENTKVVFDAYVLESRDETTDYTYTLDVGYGVSKTQYTLGSTTAITQRSGLSTGYYLIYHTSTGRYLTAGTNTVESATLSALSNGMELETQYVWRLEAQGENYRYYIRTVGDTEYYVDNPSAQSIGLDPLQSVYFSFSNSGNGNNRGIVMRSSGSGQRYVAVSGITPLGTTNNSGTTNRFRFYRVTADEDAGLRYSTPIVLKTIDPLTAQVTGVTEICRNDFINVLVTVAYNQENGEFEFIVNRWDEKQGEIEFN